MVSLTSKEILDELANLGIYTPYELRVVFLEYTKYFSHDYIQIISPHE